MKIKSLILTSILFFIFFQGIKAQLPKFQSAYIFNICRFIEWPQDYRTGNFVIGVLGANAEIIPELEEIAKSKKMFGQTIEVLSFKSVDAISKCHVLFVPDSQTKNLPMALVKIGTNSTLLISDKEDALSKGSAINFIFADNKLKFELKKDNAVRQQLKLNPELDKLAMKVL